MSPAGPLAGRRIVVTRPRAQAAELVQALEALGARVALFPTIRIVPAPDPGPLRRAAASVSGFDRVVFTSANAVEHFWEAMESAGVGTDAFDGVAVCAIGPATAAALVGRGVRPDLVPPAHVAEAVVEALARAEDLRGRRVLLPRAEIARDVLPRELRARGAEVVEVDAYRTLPDEEGGAELRRLLAAGEVDMVTFTSGSTVRSFVAAAGTELEGARVASIGPVTSAAARELGLRVDVEADEHTTAGLARAIRAFYEAEEAT